MVDPLYTWSFKDAALLYFDGSEGDAIDALSGIFIPAKDF